MNSPQDTFILASVIQMFSPPIQKKILYKILENSDIKLNARELEEMEKMYGLEIAFDKKGMLQWLDEVLTRWDQQGPTFVHKVLTSYRETLISDLEKLRT